MGIYFAYMLKQCSVKLSWIMFVEMVAVFHVKPKWNTRNSMTKSSIQAMKKRASGTKLAWPTSQHGQNVKLAQLMFSHASACWPPTMDELVDESDLWNTAPRVCPTRIVHRVPLWEPSLSLCRICSNRGINSAITKWAVTNNLFNMHLRGYDV